MTATRAFDLAQLAPEVPANPNDGVLINAVGPPYTTKFAPVVVGSKSGIVVGNSMPAATAQNQILISGTGPGFAWALGTNPAAAASVPAPAAQYSLLMADATPAWANTSIGVVLGLGGAVTTAAGGTFVPTANLVFTPTGALATRLDGGDPAMSRIDGFSIDCGVF